MKRFSSLLGRFLSQRDPDGAQYHLTRLWRHWAEVVGEHYASLARPIGHRGTTLRIGVEDHMLMQDMTLYAPQLLAQANEFLGMNFFDKVRVELIGDHVSLDSLQSAPATRTGLEPKKPPQIGGLLEKLDPESPFAKCYCAYVRTVSGQQAKDAETDTTTVPKEDKRYE